MEAKGGNGGGGGNNGKVGGRGRGRGKGEGGTKVLSSEEFEKRLGAFEMYVNEITQRDAEITLDERRKKILG